jgi:ferrochelatase
VTATGVLVMAYGTPTGLDDVESYYTNILGRRPPEHLLEELKARYAAIGGRSPLYEITLAQAQGIGERLGLPVYVGQKFNHPFIAEAVERAAADGIQRLVGLVLAPHYSSLSIGDYRRRAHQAAEACGYQGSIEVIGSWHLEPGYVSLLAGYVQSALASLSDRARAEATVVFTAHSLPERIVAEGDPYPKQLAETADAVAAEAGLRRYTTGWQSAGRTPEPWLGPDLLEVLAELAADGARAAVVCPCGFVADHLEVLYDVDIEARAAAEELSLELVRTASPNDDPAFLDTLAGVVRRALTA